MQNNEKGGGCIAGILVFCFLSGNIFLFGGINEAKDNSFAIMMVIFALFADVFLAVYLIRIVLNSISKKNSNNNTHQDKSDTLYKNTFDNPEELNGKKYTAFYEPEKQPSIETKSDTITPLPNHKEIFAEGFRKSDTKKSSSKSDNEEEMISKETTTATNEYQSLYNVLSALYIQKTNDERIIKTEQPKCVPIIAQEKTSEIPWGRIDINSEPAEPTKTYKPEKIVRKKPSIIESIHKMDKIVVDDDILYPKHFYSCYDYNDYHSAKQALLFYKKALFMADAEDDYKYKDNTYCNYYCNSTFEYMDLREKREYFSWRTQIRKGEHIKAKPQYVLVYLSELINNIPQKNNSKERFDYFLDFVVNIDSYMINGDYYNYLIKEWLVSFYVLNDVPYSKYEFNSMLPERYRCKENEFYDISPSTKYSESKELLNRYSNYKFLNSIFYESEYGYLLPEAIDYVFKTVEEYLKKFRINWFDAIFNSIEYEKDYWYPYQNLTFYVGEQIPDKEVELVNGEKYIIKDGKGYRLFYGYYPNPYSGAIAYTIKIIENELRKALGFRAKLRPNSNIVTENYYCSPSLIKKYGKRLIRFCSEEYKKLVEESTVEFFDSTGIDRMIMSKSYQQKKEKAKQKAAVESAQSPAPIVLEIDRSKFESIRKVSEEIQSALIIDDDDSLSSDNNIQSINSNSVESETEEKSKTASDEFDSDNEYVMFINSLSSLEKQVLEIVVYADTESLNKLNRLAISNNDMLEAVIDRINEKALEYIDDNVIDFSEVPVVYEDYSEEVKKALQEVKYDEKST